MALQDTAHKKPRGLSAAIPVLYPNENWLYSIARTKTKALLGILILPSSMILISSSVNRTIPVVPINLQSSVKKILPIIALPILHKFITKF